MDRRRHVEPRGQAWRRVCPAVVAALAVMGGMPLARVDAAPQPADPGRALEEIEQTLEAERAREAELARQAEAITQELAELRARLVGLAAESRRLDAALAELERDLAGLEAQETDQVAQLHEDRAALAALLGALERVARTPPEAMIARPEVPEDTLRAALVLRSVIPALRARATDLAQQLARLDATRAALAARRAEAEATRAALAARNHELAALVARREQLQLQTEEERQAVAARMARLAAEAEDLRALLARLEAERRRAAAAQARQVEEARQAAEQAARERLAALKPPTLPPMLKNGLLLPVSGSVKRRYGEVDRFGATSRGLTIEARPGAPVVAPREGSILFAGPFRGYGQILIVEHSNGYHSLIAGLGRIDCVVGQRVLAGEPVGSMGFPDHGNPDLYFELRRNGQPINPQGDLTARKGKGQG